MAVHDELFVYRRRAFGSVLSFRLNFQLSSMKILSNLMPDTAKALLKRWLLRAMHAKPEIVSRVATRIAREGVPRYLNWSFAVEREGTLQYIKSMQVGDYAYKFSESSSKPSIYGSVYACMLLGMFGELDQKSQAYKHGWLEYFDGFQDQGDGYFRDPLLAGPAFEGTGDWGDGWGVRHLAGHIIITYARLGRPPRHSFRFLEPYYDSDYLNQWLGTFDFARDVWSRSNYIMNVFTLLQYARDFMYEKRADLAVQTISQWLISRQRSDTGLWHDYMVKGYPEIGDAIRGAYHFFPLWVYEGKAIQYPEAVIDTVLRSQNSWGGFNPEECPSGACEDIDAIEPLIRAAVQSAHRTADVEHALERAMIWILSCRNGSGGYESLPEHGCSYGAHPLTSSNPGEANLFATWFRSLCLAYVADYLALPQCFSLGSYPGYEIILKRESRS